jgi:hypothetical protein
MPPSDYHPSTEGQNGGQMQTPEDFLKTLKATNKGLARNASISLEDSYIKWLDEVAQQTSTNRSRVVKQLIEEKIESFSPSALDSDGALLKTTVTLHPAIAQAVKRAGGNVNDIVNQALAQALELEVVG